jgi:hypothetical protein
MITGFGDPDVWLPASWASDSRVGCRAGEGATPSTWKPTTLRMGGLLVLAASDLRRSMASGFTRSSRWDHCINAKAYR